MTLQSCYTFLYCTLSSNEFLLTVRTVAFIFKAILLGLFFIHVARSKRIPASWRYLGIVIIAAAFEDLSWIFALSRNLFLSDAYEPLNGFIKRVAWSTNILMYHSLFIFIETFKSKTFKIRFHHYALGAISFGFFAILSFITFFRSGPLTTFELSLREWDSLYTVIILVPITIISGFYSLRNTQLPSILRLQLKTCLQFFLFPYLIANIWELYPFKFVSGGLANCLPAVSFSAMFLSLAIYQCIKRIIGLRFFDLHEHVHDDQKFDFVNDFKTVLEDLGKASNSTEIKLLTQHFFHKAFSIPPENISLSIRSLHSTDHQKTHAITVPYQQTIIETFLEIHDDKFREVPEALTFLQEHKILIYDEIAYNHFHNPSKIQETLLCFLEKIDASIFLPIYGDSTIIAYITVQRGARRGNLYTNVERDEMLVFGSYLSKVINLLQTRNLQELFKQKKEMIEELYNKHQEINRYKESIRSFLRNNKDQTIGVFFYKSRRFTFGNKAATDILGIDPNTQSEAPLTKKLKTMINQITSYKAAQTQMITNGKGKQIVLLGMPHPEVNGAIFVAHYPEISDTIKHLLDAIHDPSNWDYLLYLETTESGRLINKLIPSDEEQFINFKVELLKSALSKKALLLSLPDEDLTSTIEILHHISLRETLHVLELSGRVSSPEIPISLFGINNLFGSNTMPPLLEKLNKKGTLVIKNIHFLDLDSQDNLAECIKYGFYKMFKSNKKVQTDVRIIATSNQDLKLMVQEGTFSQILYNELKRTSLTMPSLVTLESTEIGSLVEGFADQALAEDNNAKVINLTDEEKKKIFKQKPGSLHELKRKVKTLIMAKVTNDSAYEKTKFNPAFNISDPQLAKAAQMGKYALKDAKMMALLWNKFKNQNRIAEFLGVNRSSVHRRCKDYGLL